MNAVQENKLIRQRFSDAARGYATHADIQAVLAEELVGQASFLESAQVLDVGAGDGTAAKALVRCGADVVALDLAWGMVEEGHACCPQVAWLQADACAMPFCRKSFDAVVSSSVYQWVEDLPGAFREVKRVLKPGGHFSAALFGRVTLDEFFVSLERAACRVGRKLPPLRRMPGKETVKKALDAAGFKAGVVSTEERVAEFRDLKAILKWLKGIGANGLARDFFWGKALLAAMEKEYRAAFSRGGKLQATFEVVWIEAKT